MNILKRFTSTLVRQQQHQHLQIHIKQFINQIKTQQQTNSGSMFKCIDLLISKHQNLLIDIFKLPPHSNTNIIKEKVFQTSTYGGELALTNLQTYEQRKQLMKDNSIKITKQYGNFIKELYPRTKKSAPIFRDVTKEFDVVNNSTKYSSIVFHDRLYQAYMNLPCPAPLFMTSEDLNQLIQVFLYSSRNFHRLNISTNIKDTPNFTMRRYAQDKLEQRNNYSQMCSKILRDIVNAKLPLTPSERIKLTQLTFFKDRQDVTKYYEHVNSREQLSYREFNYTTYTQLKQALPKGINSDLLLLDLALRHEQFDVVKEIWNSSEYVIGSGAVILLNYFQYNLDKPDTIDYLVRIISEINQVKLIKPAIIDEVISLLTKMGKIDLAQELIAAAYYPNNTRKSWIHYSERDYYNLCRSIYHRLVSITKDYEVIAELQPNIKTFLSLIEYYSYSKISSFNQVRSALTLMNKTTDIPTTQVFYKHIVKGFQIYNKQEKNYDWTIDNLLEITSEIIGEVNIINSQQAIMDLIKDGDITSLQNLQPTFEQAFNRENNPDSKTSISADFLNIILQAYLITLDNCYNSTKDTKYVTAMSEIEKLAIRHKKTHPHISHTSHKYSTIIDNETETKKAYLIEVVNKVSDIIGEVDIIEEE